MSEPLLIAHRGDNKNYPGNTMEAFESAFEKGADGIELDIHEQDGRLVVVHNYTYDQSGNYPELHQVLEAFADDGRLEIEVKSLDTGFIAPLKEVLSAYPEADIELTTSVAGIVHYIRENFPERKFGAILSRGEFEPWMAEEGFLTTKIVKLAQLYQADIIHLYPELVNEEVVTELQTNGFTVHSHIHALPIEEQLATYDKFVSLGVSQMTIDDTGLITAVRNR